MNLKPAVLVMLLLALTVGMQSKAAAQDSKQSLISSLVRQLGYGAAIHNFKNYELRSDDKYRVNAEKYFAAAEKTIAALRNSGALSVQESIAVDEIGQMIDGYQAGLPMMEKLYASSVSKIRVHKQIDEAVKVDDTAALAALEQLRRPHNWSRLEAMEYALGYGGAIHNFKNFALRGQSQYHTRAAAKFAEAKEILAQLAKDNSLTSQQKQAVADIKHVVFEYSEDLPVLEGTWAPVRNSKVEALINMTMVAADRVVRVNDTPALNGLSVLRAN